MSKLHRKELKRVYPAGQERHTLERKKMKGTRKRPLALEISKSWVH